MAAWTKDELNAIGGTDELRVAARRPDGTLQNPVTIWVVRRGDDLYVRSYKGNGGKWYRGTQVTHTGHIESGGVEKDVTFDDADPAVEDEIDAAYRTKYHGYAANIVDPMLAEQARATTLKLVPA